MARLIHHGSKDDPPQRLEYNLDVQFPNGGHFVFMWYVLPSGALHLACNPEMCGQFDRDDIARLLDKTAAALHGYVRKVG